MRNLAGIWGVVVVVGCGGGGTPPSSPAAPSAAPSAVAPPTTSAPAPVTAPVEKPLSRFGVRVKKGDATARFETVTVFTTAGNASVKLHEGEVDCPKDAWETGGGVTLQLAPQLQTDGSTRTAVRAAMIGGATVATKGTVELSADGQKLTASKLVLGDGPDAMSLDGTVELKVCGPLQFAELTPRPQPKATFTIAGKTLPLLGAVVKEQADGAWSIDVSTGLNNCGIATNGVRFGVQFQATGEASGSLSGDLVAFSEPVASAPFQAPGAPAKKPPKTAPKPPYDRIKKGRGAKGAIAVDVDVDATLGGYTVKLKGKLDAELCPAPLPPPKPTAKPKP